MSGQNDTLTTHGEGERGETIRVQRSRSSKSSSAFLTPKLPLAALSTSPSDSGGMENISLTSPSVGGSEQQVAPWTPKRIPEPSVPEHVLSSPFRRLFPRPEPPKGSQNDPILLEEYSPRRKVPILTDLRRPQIRYTYQKIQHKKVNRAPPARRALAPKPTNTSTFTGNKSKDMDKMMHAKAAVTNWIPHVPQMPNALRVPTKPQMPNAFQVPTRPQVPSVPQVPPAPQSTINYEDPVEVLYRNTSDFRARYSGPITSNPSQDTMTFDLPFEVQYPGTAEFLARYGTPNAPLPTRSNPTTMPISFACEPEDMLRKRAATYIRTETEAKVPDPSDILHAYIYPNDLIDPLVSQANLLSSLLQAYPESVDQQGLREDIGRLVDVQKRGVEKWMEMEEEKVRRTGGTSLQQFRNMNGVPGQGEQKGAGKIERLWAGQEAQRKRNEGLLARQNAQIEQRKRSDEIGRLVVRQNEQRKRDEEARRLLARQDAQKKGGRSNGFLAKMNQQRKKDEEMRGLLSAEAGIWAGSGEGVVDVFAAEGGEKGGKDAEERSVKRKMGVCGWEMVE